MKSIYDILRDICKGRSDAEDTWNHFYAWHTAEKTEPEQLEWILSRSVVDDWIKQAVIKKISEQADRTESEKRLLLDIYDHSNKENIKKKEADSKKIRGRHVSKVAKHVEFLIAGILIFIALYSSGIFGARDILWMTIIIAIELWAILDELHLLNSGGSLTEATNIENSAIRESFDTRLAYVTEESTKLSDLHKVIASWNVKHSSD